MTDRAEQDAYRNALRAQLAPIVAAAVDDGRLHPDVSGRWVDYLSKQAGPNLDAALASLAALTPATAPPPQVPAAASVAASRTSTGRRFPGARQVAASAYTGHSGSAYEQALASGETPLEPFATGALPAVTASGIDPALLETVPWSARWAVAQAADMATVASLLERYAGEDGEVMASLDLQRGKLGGEPAAYAAEFRQWVTTAGTPMSPRADQHQRYAAMTQTDGARPTSAGWKVD